ncbi:uncharacterized protein [Apostichopus japonicus]|uniref:uncharacterized protein n=1 Tax=Stichopus japonicus TaxID=307972 RepID=UPI003AB37ACB
MTTRDGLVYVGLDSNEVIVLDARELRIKKTIILKGLVGLDYPWDITVSHNKLFICTAYGGRALIGNSAGGIEQEYINTQYSDALSITVSEEKGLIFILWGGEGRQVVVYSLSGGHSSISGGHSSISGDHILACFKVPDYSRRLRINNNINRLFLVTWKTGKVHEYHTSDIFTFDYLLMHSESLIEKDDCQKLLDYLKVTAKESKNIIESDAPFSSLVHHLREAGKVSFDDINHLMTACSEKGLSKLVAVLTVFQQAQDSKFTKKVTKGQLKAFKDKRQELSHKLSESEDEKQQLTRRLKTTEEERQQFKDTLKATEERQQLTARLKTTEEAKQQLTARLKTTEKERQQFKDALKATEEAKQQLTGRLKTTEEERQQLTARLKTTEEERQQFKDTLKTTEEERQQLTARLKTTEERQQFKDTMKAAEEEGQQLTGRLKTTEEERQQLTARLKTTEKERQQFKDALKATEEAKQQLTGRLKKTEEERQQLTARLKTTEEERQQFKDTLKTTEEEERQQLTGRLKTTEEERQQFKDTLKTTEEERQQLIGRLKTTEEERQQFKDALKATKEAKQQLTGRLKTTEKERQQLTARLKTTEEERQQFKHTLKTTEERQQLTGRLKTTEEETQQFKDTLKTTEEERQQLTGRLKTTEEERQQFKDTMKTTEEERKQLIGRLKTTEEERQQLTARLKTTEEDKQQLTGRLKTTEEERQQLTARLKTTEEERQHFRDGLNTTENKLKTLKNEHEEAKYSLRATKDELVKSQLEYAKESMALQEVLKQTREALNQQQLAYSASVTEEETWLGERETLDISQGSTLAADYGRLMVNVAQDLTLDSTLKLATLFRLPPAETDMLRRVSLIETPGITLINFMKTRNIINMYDVTNLQKGLVHIQLKRTNEYHLAPYQSKVDPFQFEENQSPQLLDWPVENVKFDPDNEPTPSQGSDEREEDHDHSKESLMEREDLPKQRKDSQILEMRHHHSYIEHRITNEGGTISIMGYI